MLPFFSRLPPTRFRGFGRASRGLGFYPQAGWPNPTWFVNVSAAIPIGSHRSIALHPEAQNRSG